MSAKADPAQLLERASAWLDQDSDPQDRAELEALLAGSSDPAKLAELAQRFDGPLEFGTAGLRGLIGAGESRMSMAVVKRTTWGLCQHLLHVDPHARGTGLVVGRDGRRRSPEFLEATAGVAVALGIPVHLYPGPIPTPLVSFAVRHLGAAAGVAVTASHNPPEYNGYKVFRTQGAQIVPPEDASIAAFIAKAPPARAIPTAPLDSALVFDASPVERAYLDALARHPALRANAAARPLRLAYTALHGVGERLCRAALAGAGHANVASVTEQSEPDPTFPTVRFPNPEEPGAMSLLLDLARNTNADLAIANDPDADRLCVAVPNESGDFTVLTGDEVGVLLGVHALERVGPGAVISTVVSSTQLGRIARERGATPAETLTGFKWIAHRGQALEASGTPFVFGYEEALGYAVGGLTWDKDGISAATAFAALVSDLTAKNQSVLSHLFELRRRYGYHRSQQKSVVLSGPGGQLAREAAMARLRANPPHELAGLAVLSTWDLWRRTKTTDGEVKSADDLPPSDVLIFELEGGGRASVRPSGTEPKIKLYLEVVEELSSGRARAEEVARDKLGRLIADLSRAAGLA